MYKLKREQFMKIYDSSLSPDELENLRNQIDLRFKYIVKKIADILGNHIYWSDYSNRYESKNSYFDEKKYEHYIKYVGNFSYGYYKKFMEETGYNKKFPTAWLYEDFSEQLKKELEDFKIEQYTQTVQQKSPKNNDIVEAEKKIAIIKNKLTEEELKIFKHLSANQVAKKLSCLNKIDKSVLLKLTLEELLLLELNLKE